MSETEEERQARFDAEAAAGPTVSETDFRRLSRRSFFTGAAGIALGGFGFHRLQNQSSRPQDTIPRFLRAGHDFNESLWSTLSDGRMAPTFAANESSILRVNGTLGIRTEIDQAAWTMQIDGPDGTLGTNTLADITALPKTEMTVQHKCVEGWSHIVTWGGTRFSEFYELYRGRLGSDPKYVGLETPDGGYYVGLEFAAMMHPQTMLTYELQGEALNDAHGAPLRLTTPNKYGIKQLKRIGRIFFTDEKPPDYWAQRGYDYYAAL